MQADKFAKAVALWRNIFSNLRERETNPRPLDKSIELHRAAINGLVTKLTASHNNDHIAMVKTINDSAWNIPGSYYYTGSKFARCLYHITFSSPEKKDEFIFRTKLPDLLLQVAREIDGDKLPAAMAQRALLTAMAEFIPSEAAAALPRLIEQTRAIVTPDDSAAKPSARSTTMDSWKEELTQKLTAQQALEHYTRLQESLATAVEADTADQTRAATPH